jgi:hypothetical protein
VSICVKYIIYSNFHEVLSLNYETEDCKILAKVNEKFFVIIISLLWKWAIMVGKNMLYILICVNMKQKI